MKKSVNILVMEGSPIISEGLSGILNKSGFRCTLSFSASFEDMDLLIAKNKPELVIANPTYIQNNPKALNALKCKFNPIKWIGLIYCYYDPKVLSVFDGLITISDTAESIVISIKKMLADDYPHEQIFTQEILSEREIDVLKLLATGMANKEIADKLNISVNTVITHRKNIAQKTGIKSVSGLTIYAVVQKLVSIDNYKE